MDIKHLYPKTTLRYIPNDSKYAYCDTDSVKAIIAEINSQAISQPSNQELPYHIVDLLTGKVIR